MNWNTSESITAIMPAFVAALGEIPAIPKEQTASIPTKAGGSYGYSYADLASVLALIRPVLATHGLAVTQAVSTPEPQSVQVCTTIFHKSGEWIKFDPLSMPTGGTAQATGSAITYARRYSLMACLGLAAEDDDGALASATPQRNSQPIPVALSAEPRSEDERYIREIIAGLPSEFINDVKKAFKAKFGKLGELDLDRHSEALTWTTEMVAKIELSLETTVPDDKTEEGTAEPVEELPVITETQTDTPFVAPITDTLASKTQITSIKSLFRGNKTNANDQISMVSGLIDRKITDLTELTSVEAEYLKKII